MMVYTEKYGTFMTPAPRQPPEPGCEPIPSNIVGAKDLISHKVIDMAGESIGKVEEVMVDLRDGCIGYVVLSSGGFLSASDKLFAVPWQAFTVDTCEKRLVLNASKDRFEKAPSFHKDFWPDMNSEDFHSELLGYYSAQAAAGGETGG